MSTNKQQQYEQQITEARAKLETFLNGLSDEEWETFIFSEEQNWRVGDIVSHLVENERAMSIHIYRIRQGRETVPTDFDIDQWNEGLRERMGTPSRAELMEGLKTVRVRTLEGLAQVEDGDWELEGHHPLRQKITVAQYYETIAFHDLSHMEDIKKALG
ncbi:MAG: DinB family protein [Chloroflexota bacterium]